MITTSCHMPPMKARDREERVHAAMETVERIIRGDRKDMVCIPWDDAVFQQAVVVKLGLIRDLQRKANDLNVIARVLGGTA